MRKIYFTISTSPFGGLTYRYYKTLADAGEGRKQTRGGLFDTATPPVIEGFVTEEEYADIFGK